MSVATGTPTPSNGMTDTNAVSGWLAILQEDDANLQTLALQNLLHAVDTQWHEMAYVLPDIEAMAEEQGIKVAALLASRILYYLQEPLAALRMAILGNVVLSASSDPYTTSMIQTALNAYIRLRRAKHEGEEDAMEDTDALEGLSEAQLEPLVKQFMQDACSKELYKETIGICLEAHWMDQLQQIIAVSEDLVLYTWEHGQRNPEIANLVAQELERRQSHPDILMIVYQVVKDSAGVAKVLQRTTDAKLQLQLAFDLQDSGDQGFVQEVVKHLPEGSVTDATLKVLSGGFVAELSLSFLHKNSRADRGIMTTFKTKLEERRSTALLHNAAVVTHGYLYAGTTNDSFLRDNLEWMKKASLWAKFTATASLGVVHAAHVAEATTLLEPYMPDPEAVVAEEGGYAEAGALYALGLIHGSHPAISQEARGSALDVLRTHLRRSHVNEVLSHGAALGVGLTAMGSADAAIVQELKEVLDTDSAIAGDAAGLAIGMVLVGRSTSSLPESLQDIILELKNYARETKHEKIIRGIAMGLALMSFGQESGADALIEELRADRDPILRYGAQYATALAYAGTGHAAAIRLLLHTAVSDVSDDVRMAAVIGLAFVLYKTPERVPKVVQLLLESFNPHVRYASCMAVGIALAGTGDSESVALLEPMLEDMTDYVRQGALMGTAMIYMQQSDATNGHKVRFFREKLINMVSEKHHSNMTKMGAVLSMGIMDAGGRNCSLKLGSTNGFTRMSSTVGLVLWLQHWHWYPMMHMFSLALTPTLTIGLTEELKYPKQFHIVCNSKPSAFAYPKKMEEKKEKEKKRVETVTLSITAKEKARQARKKAKAGDTDMDAEETKEETPESNDGEESKMEVDNDGEDEAVVEKPKKKREPEPSSFKLDNPARVTKTQALLCAFDPEQRYRPVRPTQAPVGVVILTDSTPDEKDEELGAVKPPSLEPEGETAPPEPFEWTPPPIPVAEEPTADTKEEANSESDAKPDASNSE